MNLLRRLLLFLWSLLLVACAAVVGVCAFRMDVSGFWLFKLETLFRSGTYTWYLVAVAAVLLVLGVLGVFVSFARKSEPTQVVIGASEGGQVNISLAAVDNVVKKACEKVVEVCDVKTKIKAARDGVAVYLRLTVPHEINVPETAANVQAMVKQQLEGMTGLQVTEVQVLIANVEDKPGNTALPAKTTT